MQSYHGVILTDALSYGKIRPLGAYRIADELRKNGYNILVIDWFTKIPKNKLFEILEKFISSETLFFGYSSSLFTSEEQSSWLPVDFEYFKEINLYVKQINSKIQIIFGGANSKSLTTYNLRFKSNLGVDYVMHGFSDKMIIDFVNNIKNNLPQQVSKKILNLSEIDYDIKGEHFDFRNNPHRWDRSDFIFSNEALPLEVARGCIFRCKFCAYPLLGKNPKDDSYIKNENLLLSEIVENYQKYKTTTYFITDDTFNERTDKIELMLRVRDKSKINLNFVGYNRIDLIARKPEQLKLLKDLNFNGMFFGIESFNYESAKSIGKGIRPEEIKENLYKIKEEFKNNVSITGGFIIGLPYETPDTFNEWISWVESSDSPIDSIAIGALGLSFTGHNESDFSKNPEKYGYTRVNNGTWINREWNYWKCQQLARDTKKRMLESKKLKVSSFMAAGLLKFGYKFDELINTPRIDVSNNHLDFLTKNLVDKYVDDLLQL